MTASGARASSPRCACRLRLPPVRWCVPASTATTAQRLAGEVRSVSERGNKAQGAFGRLWGGKSTSDAGTGGASDRNAERGACQSRRLVRPPQAGPRQDVGEALRRHHRSLHQEEARGGDARRSRGPADRGRPRASTRPSTSSWHCGKGRFDKGISADDVRSVLEGRSRARAGAGRQAARRSTARTSRTSSSSSASTAPARRRPSASSPRSCTATASR